MARRAPLFLKRRSYRLRRLRDAARILPVLGGFLLMLPILWSGQGTGTGAGADSSANGGGTGIAQDGLYLFIVWFGLVAVAAALSRGLAQDPGEDDAGGDAS